MPEGPSIVILKEALQPFKGKKVIACSGNTKVDVDWVAGKKITDFKSWGKHFLICFKDRTIRIHLMLFGSYRINEKKDATPRLSFRLAKGEINFYACMVKVLEGDLDKIYDWERDVMNDRWNPRKTRKSLKAEPDTMVCDALMEQTIFSGVGNIIKNEVLFRIRVHPESETGNLPPDRLTALIKEARTYSFEFLTWKKEFTLKKHWLAYAKKTCPRCKIPLLKKETGKRKRRSFFCENCQVLY